VQLSQYEIERRREYWTGSAVGLIFYAGDALGAWWLLDALHYGRQQYLAVPLLACGVLFIEGFAFRKISDRVATAFVLAGICATPFALFFIHIWLTNAAFPG